MTGNRQSVLVSTVIAGLMFAAVPAAAQQVPLPTPGPQPRSGAAVPPPPAAVPEARPGAQAQPAAPSSPAWLPSFLGGAPSAPPRARPTVNFNPQQRALVDKVSAYLSSVHAMTGDFVQVGPDGSRANGKFYLQKPGKVRFEYDPPSPIEIIADGSSVVVRDRKLATQDLYPAVADTAALPAGRPDRPPARHQRHRRHRRRVFVTDRDRGEAGADRHQPADDDVRRQGHSVAAMDGDRSAGLRHHGRGLQSRQQARPDPNLFRIDYTDYRRDR